ncbi:elongation factor 1-gamma 3-like protein, partial [Tanacetum coccineum]
FWDMLDPKGYSLWFCTYKYNDENTVSLVTMKILVDSSKIWIMHESTPLGRYRSVKEDHICHYAARNLRTNERRIIVNGK